MTIVKTVVVLVSALATLVTAQAPTNWIPRAEADDRVFGWMKVYNLGSATKPLTIDHRVYSPAQMTVANNLMNWIQQSYVPVGGLGDVLQWASPRMSPYNQYTRSLPPAYGAFAKIYTDLKPGAGGRIEPATNSHYWWSIWVNAVCGEPAVELSTPDQYHFTLPTWDERSDNAIADLEKAVDVSQHPVLGRFPSVLRRSQVHRPRQGQPAAVREADQRRISRRAGGGHCVSVPSENGSESSKRSRATRSGSLGTWCT